MGLSILWIFKYIFRGPELPMASCLKTLWWNSNPNFTEHGQLPSSSPTLFPPASSGWGLFCISDADQRHSSAWRAPSVLCPRLRLHCLPPSRVLPCAINPNVSGRAFVLSFLASPSSLLTVTSRCCSYQYIPLWHFSLAMCPSGAIILADASTSIIYILDNDAPMILWNSSHQRLV